MKTQIGVLLAAAIVLPTAAVQAARPNSRPIVRANDARHAAQVFHPLHGRNAPERWSVADREKLAATRIEVVLASSACGLTLLADLPRWCSARRALDSRRILCT
jgi:hypothetical protein